jgi:hypothetical protein
MVESNYNPKHVHYDSIDLINNEDFKGLSDKLEELKGRPMQLFKSSEELLECSLELHKILEYWLNNNNFEIKLTQIVDLYGEIVDVLVTISKIILIFDNRDILFEQLNYKIDRTKERIEKKII